MHYRRNLAGLLTTAIAVIALSACGSSSSISTAGSKAAGTAAAATTSSSTATIASAGGAINLGSICSCSGVQASALSGLKTVDQAWVASVNAAGGINGHRVKMTVLDDAGNPSTALQDAKILIQHDHVIAIVGDDSLADASFVSYVTKSGVPVVGGLPPSSPFLTSPDWFSEGSSLPVQSIGTAALGKAAGKTKIGVLYCSETPLCAEVVPLLKLAGGLTGVGVTAQAVSSTAPSYAAPCLALKSAGVDALFIADNGSVVQRITDQCAQQGYKPVTVSQTNTAQSTWLSDPNFNGALLSSADADYTDASVPGVDAFLTALKKYAPGFTTSSAFTSDTFYAWESGALFLAAAKAADIGPKSTPADVKKGLYALKDETLGGSAPPITYTPGKPAFLTCYFTVGVEGGKFVALHGGKPTCLSATQATALGAALKKLL